MTEKQAESYFRKVSLAKTNGKPVCPDSGSLEHFTHRHTFINLFKICFFIFEIN